MAHLTRLLSLRSVLTSSVFVLALLVEMSPTRANPLPTAEGDTVGVGSGIQLGCAFPTGNLLRPARIQLLSNSDFGALLFNQTSNVQLTGDTADEVTNCPLHEAVLEGWPENKASTCPWVYKNHHDADRYPSNIAQAECLCQGCLDRNGGPQDADMECRQVMYPMRVLRRHSSEDGLYKYDLEWYDVPVACTCTRPRTSPGNRPPMSQSGNGPPGIRGLS